MKQSMRIGAVAACMLLAACGGGGGGDEEAAQPDTPPTPGAPASTPTPGDKPSTPPEPPEAPESPAAPAAKGSAQVSWAAPAANADGSPMYDLAGYKLYWGTKSGARTHSQAIADPAATGFTIEKLPPATYYIVVTAIDDSGNESAPSAEVRKKVN